LELIRRAGGAAGIVSRPFVCPKIKQLFELYRPTNNSNSSNNNSNNNDSKNKNKQTPTAIGRD
jgi:hypothetical protein